MEAKREYKATFFSGLFSEPNRLRELYNALADTNYGTETDIEITTLDSAFFNDIRNDLSFIIDGKYVVLIEHQSTINENMPLRMLSYIARVFEKITDERAIYHEKLLKIPTPEFIVLYNGTKPFPAEKTLKLSDAYEGLDKSVEKFGNLELTVRVVNINPGFNDDLLQKCEVLNGYTVFVERVRELQRNGLSRQDAIKETIRWGITQDALSTFLTEHGTEVHNMIPGTTFDIDIAREVWQEEAREDGYEEAREEFQAEIAAQADEIVKKDAELADVNAENAALRKQLAELQGK